LSTLTKPPSYLSVQIQEMERTLGNEDADFLLGGTAIMRCTGKNSCLYEDTCPFCETGAVASPPVGDNCPVEVVFLRRMFDGYKGEVCPDGANWSMMCLLRDLVGLELEKMRCERILSIDGAVIELVSIGFDKGSGTIISKPEATAKLVEWRTLVDKKVRLMEQLGLTPKARAAIGSTVQKDPSSYAAELVRVFADIMSARKRQLGEDRHASQKVFGSFGDGANDIADSPGRPRTIEIGAPRINASDDIIDAKRVQPSPWRSPGEVQGNCLDVSVAGRVPSEHDNRPAGPATDQHGGVLGGPSSGDPAARDGGRPDPERNLDAPGPEETNSGIAACEPPVTGTVGGPEPGRCYWGNQPEDVEREEAPDDEGLTGYCRGAPDC